MKHLLVFPLALVLVLATAAGADMGPKSGPGDLAWIMLVSISAVVILGGAVYALLTLDDDTDDPAATSIGGRLSDALTGEPLAGVRVLLYEDWTDAATPADRSGYFIAETLTDAEGAFSFTIEPGSYLILCKAEGYEKTDQRSVSVDEGESATLLIRLTPLVEAPPD
ncbi:MAG: hypothetical protein GF403_08070 [Candidatus Coatesbacteria bacterium]|nr:hypothetical protein [Candidatus Coatesbacteria bacterium]